MQRKPSAVEPEERLIAKLPGAKYLTTKQKEFLIGMKFYVDDERVKIIITRRALIVLEADGEEVSCYKVLPDGSAYDTLHDLYFPPRQDSLGYPPNEKVRIKLLQF